MIILNVCHNIFINYVNQPSEIILIPETLKFAEINHVKFQYFRYLGVSFVVSEQKYCS